MAERRLLAYSLPDAFPEEILLTDTTTFGGLTLSGNLLMGGNLINGLGSPLLGTDAANKAYVDTLFATHPELRQLIHFIDQGPAKGFASGAYKETLPVGPFPTSVIWWTSVAKTHKIVEKTITYTGPNPTTIVWKMYATDGVTVIETVTDAISYTGPFEATRTRTIV